MERCIIILLLWVGVYSCKLNACKNNPFADLRLVYTNYDTLISGNNHYGLLVYADKHDTFKARGKIVLQTRKENKWVTADTISYDNTWYYQLYDLKNDYIEIKFADINNDGVKDIFFFSGWGGRQANEFYQLYLIDNKKHNLIALKSDTADNNFFFVNPYYEKNDSTLMTSSLFGDTVIVTKYKVKDNSIVKQNVK